MKRYGQVATFDKQSGQGTIHTFDSAQPLPFMSKEPFEKDEMVRFDTAIFCINVTRNTQRSTVETDNVSSDACHAGTEALKNFDPAYWPGR